MTTSNLPPSSMKDDTRLFFSNYGTDPVAFNSADVDAAITFFTSRGFEEDAAVNVAGLILLRAKADGTPIFKILDELKKIPIVQISNLVARLLNSNRVSTSVLGFKVDVQQSDQIRNIAP